jgi:O-Antigen ligase
VGAAVGAVEQQVSVARHTTVAFLGVVALVLFAPFESQEPWIRVAGQSISSVEMVLLLVLVLWLGVAAASGSVPVWRTPVTWPWLTFLATMAIAAAAAPAHGANAMNMAGRLSLAFGVFLLVVNGVTTAGRLRLVVVAAAAGGVVVAGLAILEYGGFEPVNRLLLAFRPFAANVGGHVRASGPFQYPTIASMYLELTFALTLGLLFALIVERSVGRSLAVGLALFAMGQAIVLTYTRAGLITMCTSLAAVILAARRRSGFDALAKACVAVGVLIAIQMPATRSLEMIGLRMTTETQTSWYLASFDVPAEISMRPGEVASVSLKVTNAGRAIWDPTADPRFRLSYHWLLADEDRIVSWQGLRTDFPDRIAPGESVSLDARVEAPGQPGRYRLHWDIERENWLWFSTEPGAVFYSTRAVVTGPATKPLGTLTAMKPPAQVVRPGRLELWRAGARIVADRPLLGVGPDNFRLMYGGYAGIANADTRVHSNNMFLEMLVSGGIVGGLAFAWLCLGLAAVAMRCTGQAAPIAAGIAAAVVAIAVHGLFDSFLGFTSTYILMAATAGLVVAAARLTGPDSYMAGHAHRV